MLLILWLVGCSPALPGAESIGDPYYPQLGNGGYDVWHYTLELPVDPQSNNLSGLCTMEARATQPLGAFYLDFSGLTIERITVNGTEAGYPRDERELTITPARPIPEGEAFAVTVWPSWFTGISSFGWRLVLFGLVSTQVICQALLTEVRVTSAEVWRVLAEGGIAFVSVAESTDTSESCDEIEPGTYLPLGGMEQRLPPYIFSEAEFHRELDAFRI
jgi:hypothetical protein